MDRQQKLHDLYSHEFGDPPESVAANVRELERVMQQRREANERTARQRDTERYLVICYRDRAAREEVLAALGLPADERYLIGDALEIRLRPGAAALDALVVAERECQAADPAHSGAAG